MKQKFPLTAFSNNLSLCSELPFPHSDKVAEYSQHTAKGGFLSVLEVFGPWLFSPIALGPVVHAQGIAGEACG